MKIKVMIPVLAIAGLTANAATLLHIGDTTLTPNSPDSNDQFNVSVNGGVLRYEDTTGATDVTVSGTVVDYRFVGGTSGAIATSVFSGTRSTTPVSADTTVANRSNANLWVANDPGASWATEDNDYGVLGTTSTLAGIKSVKQEITGNIDISGLTEGSLFVFWGQFGANARLQVNMVDDQNSPGGDIFSNPNPKSLGIFVSQYDFTNNIGYESLDFKQTGTANHYFLGTVLVTPVPEPSAFGLIAGMFGLTWVMLRRRR